MSSDLEQILLLNALVPGALQRPRIFEGQRDPGPSPHAVICNSVPKSGTYLLTSLVKTTDQWRDTGYHCYTYGLNRIDENGAVEAERKMPALLWMEALRAGTFCAAHVEYSPYVEQYLLSSRRHKTLFIIRDPRDLVISWVDFVYKSTAYIKMKSTNAYERESGLAHYPSAADQIASTIENLPNTGIQNFVPWLSSPACHVVRFEDLYRELVEPSEATHVLEGICDYLEIPREHARKFGQALGRGLTYSDRATKIGVYLERMEPEHFVKLRDPAFQKLVLAFGYEATPAEPTNSAGTDYVWSVERMTVLRAARDEATAQQDRLQRELDAMRHDRDKYWTDRDEALAQQDRLQRELDAMRHDRDKAWTDLDQARAQQETLQRELDAMRERAQRSGLLMGALGALRRPNQNRS